MGQRLLKVRVRPPKIAILISKNAGDADLLLAFEFFSKIWGGRYGQLLPVDPGACDDLTLFRLGASRPEFIYGLGLDDGHWGDAVRRASQPRGYGRLKADFVRGIKQPHFEDYILVDHALVHLFRTRTQDSGRTRALRLVAPGESSDLTTFCAATFGVHNPNLLEEFFDLQSPFPSTATGFLELATEFVKDWQQSWLDITGHELAHRLTDFGLLAPTVVLVGSKVSDLALFWNLRTGTDTIHSAWIVPIPVECSTDPVVLEKLKDWLLAFIPYGPRSNFCQVTSQSVEEPVCRDFAARLQVALVGTPIDSVDFQAPRNRLAAVTPFEYEANWPVDITGRKLTIQPPRPKAFEDIGSSRSWIVDLLKDVNTGRAIKELQLPPSPVVFELLNGPCPPSFGHTSLPRAGDGTESINLRCSGRKEVIDFHLPTSEEILGEILREYGVEPLPDEKRNSYRPVIKRFGGLYPAASAFSGQSGRILATLAKGTKTLREVQGACKLGGGDLAGETYLNQMEAIIERESDRMKRITRDRFKAYSRHSQPENLELRSLLEYWADRDILTRHWKIGPCRRCNQQYFVPSLDIQRRIVCTNCGHRISLHAAVPVGYTLQRAVAHAMQEGLVPVAQTGRFLRSLTSQGFFWLPGVKYRLGNQAGDIDLLACCDGHLVFCECKSLDETPGDAKVWDEVVAQFVETARLAKLCRASLAVLSSRSSKYPEAVSERIRAELGDSIPYLLLAKQDLELGHRLIREGSESWHLRLFNLLPIPFPEAPRGASDKPRTISMGWGAYTQ